MILSEFLKKHGLEDMDTYPFSPDPPDPQDNEGTRYLLFLLSRRNIKGAPYSLSSDIIRSEWASTLEVTCEEAIGLALERGLIVGTDTGYELTEDGKKAAV